MKSIILWMIQIVLFFFKNKNSNVKIPFMERYVAYDCSKKIGIIISDLGASKAIALGAYAYALSRLK